MGILQKSIVGLIVASCGIAYGQSVSINGGNIRVDTSSNAKASVTNKSKSSISAKRTSAAVDDSDDGDDSSAAASKKSTRRITGTVSADTGNQRTQSGKNGQVFVNTDLSGQNLGGRKYVGASFTNVEAVGTIFKGADLSKSTMTNVDLSKADLRGANLSGAQFTNVDWDGALLDGATWPDGRRCGAASVGKCM